MKNHFPMREHSDFTFVKYSADSGQALKACSLLLVESLRFSGLRWSLGSENITLLHPTSETGLGWTSDVGCHPQSVPSHLESTELAALPSVVGDHAVGVSIADVGSVLLYRSLEKRSAGQTGLGSGMMRPFNPQIDSYPGSVVDMWACWVMADRTFVLWEMHQTTGWVPSLYQGMNVFVIMIT